MKLFTYAMGFFVLIGGFVMSTEYGLTAKMAGIEATSPEALGYPVSYMQNGQVMSAAYMDGKEVKGISFGLDDDDDLLTLPVPKKAVAGVHYPNNTTASSNRTVVHSSRNVCTTNSNSCSPTIRYYYPNGTVYYNNNVCGTQYYNSCGTRYYSNSCGTRYYHQGACGNTWNHWNYQRCQPVRNTVRFFHNARPVRRTLGRVFCGR